MASPESQGGHAPRVGQKRALEVLPPKVSYVAAVRDLQGLYILSGQYPGRLICDVRWMTGRLQMRIMPYN